MTALPVVDQAPGAAERALDEAWSLARSRLWSRSYLWRSLSLWRRFHLRTLSVGELAIKVPAGQVPDCDSCTELCCTGPNARVSLRLRDVARLLDRGHASAIVKDAPSGIDKYASWARREADASVFHRVFPVLARDRTGTCAMLHDDRTCAAFPDWPLSCARYPYALDLQLKVIFYAKSCTSTRVLALDEASPRVRALVRATVDAYNERIKDVVTLALAPERLTSVGLLSFLSLEHWPWPVDPP